jgi:GAF domain-containing protein
MPQIANDISRIQKIAAIPKILASVAHLTGMRFAAVARVTDERWVACAVHDNLEFGLLPGDQLELESTICNEIRQHHAPVVFGKASGHPVYARHHTTLRYGLESYISVPIFRADGDFFGTLCAIDNRPADIEAPAVVESLQVFAELIGLQLELVEKLEATTEQLEQARHREDVLTATELELRNLLQPVITGIYMLRTSEHLVPEDRAALQDIEAASLQIVDAFRRTLDSALDQIGKQQG